MQIINFILLLIASVFWVIVLGLIWMYVNITLIVRILTTIFCTMVLMLIWSLR